MGNIREYQSNVNPQGPAAPGRRADATDFGGGTGLQRLGAALTGVGSDLGLIAFRQQQAQEQREVTDVYVSFAKKEAEWTQRLRDEHMKADPADLTFADRFNTAVAEDLDKLEPKYETAGGRAAFMQHRAQLGTHFIERAGTTQAAMAGSYAKQSYLEFLNQKRNAVQGDPTSFDRAKDETLKFLRDQGAFTAYLPPELRPQFERMTINDLALSAVQGEIENGQAELAKQELLTGQWDQYLDADKKPQLLTAAHVAINGQSVEAERIRKAQERALKAEREAVQNQFIVKLTDGSLTVPEILTSKLEPTGEGGKEHYINMIAKRDKDLSEKPTKTKPSVMQDLYSRIHAGEGDPRRLTSEHAIDEAYLSGELAFTDVERLRKEYKEIRTEEGGLFSTRKKAFLDGVKPQIDKSNPLMGKLDQDGAHENYRYGVYVDSKIAEYRKQGKDPSVLLDPNPENTDYLGRPETVNQFKKTIQDSMKTMADGLKRSTPTAPPPPEKSRKDGETISEWIGRQWNGLFERTGSGVPPAHAEPEPMAVKPSGQDVTGVAIEDYAFTKGVVGKMSGSHRIALAGWAKLYRQGQMDDDKLRQQLEITFEPYVKKKENPDGFLTMKDFHRAVNVEMQAIKKLKAID